FYWVTLQTRVILDQPHLRGIKKALEDLPGDNLEIGGLVMNANVLGFNAIKLQNQARSQIAFRTLALLTSNLEPLTEQQLCHALAISHILDDKDRLELSEDEIPEMKSIIESCMGFIRVNPVTKIVTICHFDIANYMKCNWDVLFARDRNIRLIKICLTYLSLSVFSSGQCRQLNELDSRLKRYPFFEYASRNWGYHARQALSSDPAASQDTVSSIMQFLSNRGNLDASLQVRNRRHEKHQPLENDRGLNSSNGEELQGLTPLYIAATHGLTAVIQRIFDENPNLISQNPSQGESALSEAAEKGWEDVVILLLEAGASPTSRSKSPVISAARNGFHHIVEILQNQQTLLGKQEVVKALHDAAARGQIDVIVQLLDSGVDPNSSYGSSALTAATRAGHLQAVSLLLSYGADLNRPHQSPSEDIPLHQAARAGHPDIMELLLDHGAQLDCQDSTGRSALFECIDEKKLEIAVVLLQHGIDISKKDIKGSSVLHSAVSLGAIEHTRLFLDNGVEVNSRNDDNLTPLHLASMDGNIAVMEILLNNGADIDAASHKRKTPLAYAVHSGKEKM
ncbi:MAG: hypothetical protein Q9214_007117, partial [Letrouitia sp. 1 TL-2023]